ncbi:MAG: MFS transporter [Treponema sp.]|nr:MFS transporter [Treponema sp.]
MSDVGAGTQNPPERSYLRLSIMQFFFWFAAATGTYLTIFLIRQGFEPNQIGVIVATNSAVVIIAGPFWGTIADKLRSIRKVFLLCITISIVLWTVVPASSRIDLGPINFPWGTFGPLALMFLIIPISAFFRMPAHSLMDAFTVQNCHLGGISYGHVRLWGSVGWTVMCMILSYLLPRFGVEMAFYMYGVAFIPLYLLMWNAKGVDVAKASKEKRTFKSMGFGRLFKSYYFVTYLFFAMMMHMPVVVSMTYLPFLVQSVDGNLEMIGLVAGYKALLEIPTLLLMRPLREKFPLPVAIGTAAVLYIIEALFYTRVTHFYQIIALQTLHGLGGGFMIGAATNYIYTMAPEGLNSTAHTLLGAVNSTSGIIGSLVGGVLIMAVGISRSYMLIAITITFALVYFVATLFIGVKILKKPIPFKKLA